VTFLGNPNQSSRGAMPTSETRLKIRQQIAIIDMPQQQSMESALKQKQYKWGGSQKNQKVYQPKQPAE
jgi:hypothetical protein